MQPYTPEQRELMKRSAEMLGAVMRDAPEYLLDVLDESARDLMRVVLFETPSYRQKRTRYLPAIALLALGVGCRLRMRFFARRTVEGDDDGGKGGLRDQATETPAPADGATLAV